MRGEDETDRVSVICGGASGERCLPLSRFSIVSLGTGVLEAPVGQTVPLPVSVADIQEIYGIEFHLLSTPVVQVARRPQHERCSGCRRGLPLEPDFVVHNEVDNQAGTIDGTWSCRLIQIKL